MNKLSLFLLTILVIENILLALALYLWINRHCKSCQKAKCLEWILSKTCQKCQNGNQRSNDQTRKKTSRQKQETNL